ncbi:MAG: RHS repeat-associated core domain-containing protein, partial [Clostridia bacterium]|nr:RHS repeat-associated core domain-containing protein [Clostridia bacterium]
GTLASTIGKANPLRYRGYYYDNETELYYLQSRYYDPCLGRFISPDSLLVAGDYLTGLNRYAYCNCNPVMYSDPTGRDAVSIINLLNSMIPLMIRFALVISLLSDYFNCKILESYGVSETELEVLRKNEKVNPGDLLLIRLVIQFGYTMGNNKDYRTWLFKDNGTVGWAYYAEENEYIVRIAVCKGFLNKEICTIVGRYYGWYENPDVAAKEIYTHAMAYYYTEVARSFLGDAVDGIAGKTGVIDLGFYGLKGLVEMGSIYLLWEGTP